MRDCIGRPLSIGDWVIDVTNIAPQLGVFEIEEIWDGSKRYPKGSLCCGQTDAIVIPELDDLLVCGCNVRRLEPDADQFEDETECERPLDLTNA